MEGNILDDAEFWLPLDFLTDEDVLTEKENKVFKGVDNGGASKFLFSNESRSWLSSHRSNTALGSPVETLVGSTKTQSDENHHVAGLTSQMAHSTLQDDYHKLPVETNTKACRLSSAPQATMCAGGMRYGYLQRPAQNSLPRVQSPAELAAAWDMYCTAAEEAVRLKVNRKHYGFTRDGRGAPPPPRKPASVPVTTKNSNVGSEYYNQPSLPYQRLQALHFQHLRHQQMIKHRQMIQNRVRLNGNNGHSVGCPPSVWPMHHTQQPGSGMRAVFLGKPTGKSGSIGTGVFLPRRIAPKSPAPNGSRKKSPLSTVLVPEKVVQALNLNLDGTVAPAAGKPHIESQAGLHDASLNFRDSTFELSCRKSEEIPGNRPATSNEPRLPVDWSY